MTHTPLYLNIFVLTLRYNCQFLKLIINLLWNLQIWLGRYLHLLQNWWKCQNCLEYFRWYLDLIELILIWEIRNGTVKIFQESDPKENPSFETGFQWDPSSSFILCFHLWLRVKLLVPLYIFSVLALPSLKLWKRSQVDINKTEIDVFEGCCQLFGSILKAEIEI